MLGEISGSEMYAPDFPGCCYWVLRIFWKMQRPLSGREAEQRTQGSSEFQAAALDLNAHVPLGAHVCEARVSVTAATKRKYPPTLEAEQETSAASYSNPEFEELGGAYQSHQPRYK